MLALVLLGPDAESFHQRYADQCASFAPHCREQPDSISPFFCPLQDPQYYYVQVFSPMFYAAAVGLWVEAYVVENERFEAQRLVGWANYLRGVFSYHEARHQLEDHRSQAYIAREGFKETLESNMGRGACEVYKQCLHAKSFSTVDVEFLVGLVPHNVDVYWRDDEEKLMATGLLQVRGQAVCATYGLYTCCH